MKRILLTIAGVVVLGSLTVTNAVHNTIPAESVVPFPGPYAQSVHKYITIEDPYQKWELWPGKGKFYKARPPLDHVTTYVNDNAFNSVKAGLKMSNGSLIVTENYTAEKKLTAVFVMFKIKGYNPSGGDWFWAQYDSAGMTLAEGKVDACIECHAKVKENDYIFTDKFIK